MTVEPEKNDDGYHLLIDPGVLWWSSITLGLSAGYAAALGALLVLEYYRPTQNADQRLPYLAAVAPVGLGAMMAVVLPMRIVASLVNKRHANYCRLELERMRQKGGEEDGSESGRAGPESGPRSVAEKAPATAGDRR